MFMSSTFHCIKAHSHPVSKFGNQLDYFGIVILITCSLISIILFAYYDYPWYRNIFVGLSLFFGTVCTVLTLIGNFQQMNIDHLDHLCLYYLDYQGITYC